MKQQDNMENSNMNPVFSLKNFRSFGEEGADFELAPITVLTGCNSAGKSSLVKALMLVQPTVSEIEIDYSQDFFIFANQGPSSPHCGCVEELVFSSKELALGNYRKVLNKRRNSKLITLSYKMWSNVIQEPVIVERVYKDDRNDATGNALLNVLYVKKIDGTVIYKLGPVDLGNGILAGELHTDVLKSNFCGFSLACELQKLESEKRLVTTPLQINLSSDEEKEFGVYRDEIMGKYNSIKSQLDSENIHIPPKVIQLWEQAMKMSKERGRNVDNSEEAYLGYMLSEVRRPDFLKDTIYVNSSSAAIKRLYALSEDDKVCKAIKTYFDRCRAFEQADGELYSYRPGSFMNRWISLFGIGDKVEVCGTEEGLGVLVYIVKDGEKTLLADEGYGITQLFTLLLQIDNAIDSTAEFEEGEPMRREDFKSHCICVEEPEVHLHPKYQSLLADMFVEAYQQYNIRFIIETHSEYLIRKLQVLVADKESTLTSNDVSLNYVEKDEEGVSHNKQIKIQDDGRLSEPFGTGFYDETKKLVMQMMKY